MALYGVTPLLLALFPGDRPLCEQLPNGKAVSLSLSFCFLPVCVCTSIGGPALGLVAVVEVLVVVVVVLLLSAVVEVVVAVVVVGVVVGVGRSTVTRTVLCPAHALTCSNANHRRRWLFSTAAGCSGAPAAARLFAWLPLVSHCVLGDGQ